MPTILKRAIRLPVLAIPFMFLLAACGGGGSDPGPVATHAPPVQPSPPTPPAQPDPPGPPTQPTPPANPPTAPEPVLADAYTDLAGTMNIPPGWSAWVAPPNHAPVSGVACAANVAYHKHALVSIYKEGQRQGLPESVGRGGCAYELHTHDVMGVVHIETDVAKTFTLGQFFALWNQPLGVNGTAGLAGPVRFYLIENEKLTRYTGDPAALELVAHREIVILSGAAPALLPKYRWPSGL